MDPATSRTASTASARTTGASSSRKKGASTGSRRSRGAKSPSAAASFQSRQVETTGKHPLLTGATAAATPGKSDQTRAPAPAQLARLMPAPPVVCQLPGDEDLKERLQDPKESLRFYQAQLERRREAKAAGQIYSFPPFMTTLGNMRKLTQHILTNQQFRAPLTEEDATAFQTLGGYITRLQVLNGPYEPTVRLALMMACMLEIVTERYGFHDPADTEQVPPLAAGQLQPFAFASCSADCRVTWLQARDIPLSRVLSCRWGELNPGGADENAQLLGSHCYSKRIGELLKDDSLFVYPSFEPLQMKDFVRLSHLPVYPLGLLNGYSRMALWPCGLGLDGRIQTPLMFFEEGLRHASMLESMRHKTAPELLDSLQGRLAFRQLVIDSLPESLQPFELDKALSLIVFQLFHKLHLSLVRRMLEADSFLPVLQYISMVRRDQSAAFEPEDLAISDFQALLACLWLHRAHRFWSGRSGESLESIAQVVGEQFTRRALPAVLECWEFLEKHRAGLQAFFARRAEEQANRLIGGGCARMYMSRSPYGRYYLGTPAGQLRVKAPHSSTGRTPLGEYVDVAFFDALHEPDECEQIADSIGEPPPENCL